MQNKAGLIGLLMLGAALTWAVWHVSTARLDRPDRIVLRVAYSTGDKKIQAAIAHAAELYREQHPQVDVQQIVVPKRIYKTWTNTNFTGGNGTADLVMLDEINSVDTLMLSIATINDLMGRPNPYNRGTAFASTPWKDTFVDGLTGGPFGAFNTQTMSYYGAPLIARTYRILYNRRLLRELTGSSEEPAGFGEFTALCAQIAAAAHATGRPVFPLAASFRDNEFLSSLFRSQTLKLGLESGWQKELLRFNAFEMNAGFVTGRWDLRHDAIQHALQLTQTVGKFCQPGFLQATAQDALFYFAQGRAVMMVGDSLTVGEVREAVGFQVGAFPFPFPSADDPVFGDTTLGRITEGGAITKFILGLNKASPNRAAAVDFLQFLTSVRGETAIAQIAGQLPSVAGIEPQPEMKVFEPDLNGYRPGFDFDNLGSESHRLFQTLAYLLFQDDEGIEGFTTRMERSFPRANSEDIETRLENYRKSLLLQDAWLCSLMLHGRREAADLVVQTQNSEEGYYRLLHSLVQEDDSGRFHPRRPPL